MPKPTQPRRTLHWGPFVIGLLATGLVTLAGRWLIALSAGHWWHVPTIVVFLVLVIILTASAVSALITKPSTNTTKGPTP